MKKRARGSRERLADYEYAITRQLLVTQDLMRFNIHTLFVDGYAEITGILRTLTNRFQRRTVFVSGSDQDYRVTSGFGLVVAAVARSAWAPISNPSCAE